jgi:hypothetical protein
MTQDIRARIIQFVSKPVEHPTEELGIVYIRRVTIGELDEMQQEAQKAQKADPAATPVPMSIRMLARFLGDAQGKPLFSVNNAEDLVTLKAFPVSLVTEVLNTGNKVNKMVEEPAKNA